MNPVRMWLVTELYLAQVSLMSPVVLQLFPTPPAHVAGSSTPLVNNIIFSTAGLNLNHPFELLRRMNKYHSQREKKIFLPELRSALLIASYLHMVMSKSVSQGSMNEGNCWELLWVLITLAEGLFPGCCSCHTSSSRFPLNWIIKSMISVCKQQRKAWSWHA